MMEIQELLGKTLIDVKVNDYKTEISFTTNTGDVYKMLHYQDCCESVSIEDINGDLEHLIGSPITLAEMSTNSKDTFDKEDTDLSFTWTFYKLATVNGYVDIRWFGESNGYYSEEVDFIKVGAED